MRPFACEWMKIDAADDHDFVGLHAATSPHPSLATVTPIIVPIQPSPQPLLLRPTPTLQPIIVQLPQVHTQKTTAREASFSTVTECRPSRRVRTASADAANRKSKLRRAAYARFRCAHSHGGSMQFPIASWKCPWTCAYCAIQHTCLRQLENHCWMTHERKHVMAMCSTCHVWVDPYSFNTYAPAERRQ